MPFLQMQYRSVLVMSMIKILAIGNSFSQDATAMLEVINPNIFVRNLYIGGCSLEMHARNIVTDEKVYEYQENGEPCVRGFVSIKDALQMGTWDYITVQQVSHLSGDKDSYYPYLIELIKYVEQYSTAKILLHKTWAYEKDSSHPEFYRYDNDSEKMHRAIAQTVAEISQTENLPVIDVGELIYRLKQYDFFNVDKGGVSLYRDKFHMNFGYGRLAAALVWSKFFGGELPEFFNRKDLSEGFEIIKKEIVQRR